MENGLEKSVLLVMGVFFLAVAVRAMKTSRISNSAPFLGPGFRLGPREYSGFEDPMMFWLTVVMYLGVGIVCVLFSFRY